LELTVDGEEFPKTTLQDVNASTTSMVLVRGQALKEADRVRVRDLIQKFNGQVVQYSIEDKAFERKDGVARFEGSTNDKSVSDSVILTFVLGLNYV